MSVLRVIPVVIVKQHSVQVLVALSLHGLALFLPPISLGKHIFEPAPLFLTTSTTTPSVPYIKYGVLQFEALQRC